MKTRWLILAPCLLFSLHFVPVEQGLKFTGDWPKIPFYVNPSIPGERIGGTEALMNSVREATKLWSSDVTNVRFDFRVAGFVDRNVPFAPPVLNCSAANDGIFAQAQKAVFAPATETTDCTGVACAFVWSCEGNPVISHFDIVLNANGRSFATTDHQGNDYDVKTIVAQALGHVAGLDYCSPGVTQAQCTARMTEGQADPPPGSLMYKLLLPGVGASAASADDLAGIRSLYPVLTPSELSRRLEARGFLSHVENLCAESGCALPEDEPNPAYQLTQSERSDLLEHDSFIMQSGFADPVERLGSVLYDQMLRDTAYSSQPETAEKILQNALDKRAEIAARMEPDRLNAALHVISVHIKQKQAELTEFGTGMDADYLAFMRADLHSMILIRKAIIDEKNRR